MKNVTVDQIRAWPKNETRWHVSPEKVFIRLGSNIRIGSNVSIDSCVSIDSFVRIDSDVRISSNVRIGSNVSIGSNVYIDSFVRIDSGVRIGSDVRINSFVRIGSDVCIDSDVCIKETPLQIVGSKHIVHMYNDTKLKIGCECHSIKDWLSIYEQVGFVNGYSDKQIAEYKEYINLFASRFGISIQ